MNPTTAPSSGVARRASSSARIVCRERLVAELKDHVVAAGAAAAADRRDDRDLVAVGEWRARLGVVPVAREPHEGSSGGQHRIACDERAPRVLHRPAIGQLERHLARPGELTLDREQADADAHASRGRSAACSAAISRPSPSGRIVDVKRGSARSAVSNARSAIVFAPRRRSGGAGRAAAPQDVVGDDEAPGASRGTRASR